ncbi:hypothetical protein M065_3114 [Bacteroides fragilis str. Korea 419]|jgi:hypothetical protein|nr:hypothetical protein M065_3114 [Bacteroides fragilis str. Korea 419]
MQIAGNFYGKLSANIHKKGNNQTLVFFFLSMKSVIFAKISKAIAATKPIAAK